MILSASVHGLLSFVLALAPQGREEPLPVELVMDLSAVGAVEMAPDGRFVAYAVSVWGKEADKPGGRKSELWVRPVAGGEPVLYVTADGEANAFTFTPDSRALTFLRKVDGKSQVHVLPLDGGEALPITRAAESITSFLWSPDGLRVAFTVTDGKSEDEKKAEKEGRDWNVVDSSTKFTRLYVWDVAAEQQHKVLDADLQVWSYDWFPDGQRFVVKVSETTLTDHEYMFTRLVTVPAGGGSPEPLFATQGKLGEPKVSPDGRLVLFAGATGIHDPYAGSLFVGPSGGGEARNLTGDFEGTTLEARFLADGRIVTLTAERQQTVLRVLDAAGSHQAATVLYEGPAVLRGASFATDGAYAFSGSTPEHPPELFVAAPGGQPSRVTRHDDKLAEYALGEQSIFRWRARDGLELEGVLVRPVGYRPGGRYPLVLNIHGGPEGVVTNGWNTSYGYWSQFLATRGTMVLLPNYRASIGRGVAFSMLDHRDLGGAEFTDVIDAIDALAAAGDVDPARVGIGGGSYGGYFSAWAATRHTGRFAAAMTFAGISNWVSMLGTSDIPEENLLVHWNLPAAGNLYQFMERSPVTWVEHSRTPTLIMHGEKDLRVPIGQSQELYTLMKVMKREVEFVTYPREPHGIRERRHQIDFASRCIDWFEKHLGTAAPEG